MNGLDLKTEGRTGSVKFLRQLNKYEFAVEIWVMREGLNNNKWDYRNLKEHYRTFLGQPILIAYVGRKIGDGHNMRPVQMPDGGVEYSFMDGSCERIIGTLSEDEDDIRLEEHDGKLWMIAKGRIFAFYAREAVQKIIDTGSMDVSAETEIFDAESGKNGVEIFTNWAGLGVTILGDDVPPAIPGARIKAMSVKEDVRNMNLKAASLRHEDDDSPRSKTKQKGVKTNMSKRKIAQLQKMFTGYTVLSVSDDGNNVCLLSEQDYLPAGYTFSGEADKNGVVAERICSMNVNAKFAFDEEHGVDVDVAKITETLAEKLIAANADNEKKDQEIARLSAIVTEMQEKEKARRVSDAKKAVLSRLDVLNKDRDARCAYGKELAEAVCAKIETGCFNEICNEKGEWCGDESAVMQLEAMCAREQEKQDKAAAEKAKKTMSWNNMVPDGNGKDGDTIDALMQWVNE